MIQPSSYGWFMTWPSSIGPVPCPNFPISSPAISWPSGCDKDFWSISFTAARPDGTMGIHGDPWGSNDPGKTQAGGWGGSPMALGWTNGPMEVYPTFKHSPDFQGGECELTDDQSTNWGGNNKGTGSVGHSKWSTLRFWFGFAWNLLVYHHFPY